MQIKAFYIDYDFGWIAFGKYVEEAFRLIDCGRCIEKDIEIPTLAENSLLDQVGNHGCVVFEAPEATPRFYITTMGGTVCAVLRKNTPLRINGELAIVVDNVFGDRYRILSISEQHSLLSLFGYRVDKILWYRTAKEDTSTDSVLEEVKVSPVGDLSDDEQVWLTLQRLA